jgi:hypothetical protein
MVLWVVALPALGWTAEAQPVAGLYFASFESSLLWPCENLNEQWRFIGNRAFHDRYKKIKKSIGWDERRFYGPAIFVRVRGIRGEGAVGDMTASGGTFTVTEILEMISFSRYRPDDTRSVQEQLRDYCASVD